MNRYGARRAFYAAWAVAGLLGSAAAMAALPEGRARSLEHLLVQDCGSCHGLRLTGGLGPALTPQALAGKPAGYLREVILNGVPGTAMPPWKALLTTAEAEWLAKRLLERSDAR
jgi:cytochrome c55X